MANLPDAVTFDFHNTLAECDQWFQLEIRTLLPTFLRWHSAETGSIYDDELLEQSVTDYRKLRSEVMEHGMEVDAVQGVHTVTRALGLRIDDEVVERGVCEVMCATLADSTPVDGVVDSVRALKQSGVKLGVVSSAAYHPFLEWSLDKFGILTDFDVVVTSASSGFYKSRTEIYTATLAALGSEPSSAIHVGDSHLYDVETPIKLGMSTIWFDTRNEANEGHMADVVVTTLAGVEHRIADIFAGRRP